MAVSTIDPNGLNIGQYGNRNLIINGAMQVAQRGTSVSSVTSAGYKTCDRWNVFGSSFGTYTVSQSSTSPDGFANSLKLDCTAADTSPAAGDHLGVQMKFEGQDLQQLQKGTSTAKNVTVSFFVRSNKTGTYTLELDDRDNTRSFSKTYTIDSADTWEHKTVTFVGDTTGVLDDDNASSFFVSWWLMAGSNFTSGTFTTGWEARTNANRVSSSNVNLSDSTSNEWYITGVQLEVGDTATPFEHRSFGQELALCQRYFVSQAYDDIGGNYIIGNGYWGSSTLFEGYADFPVMMRSSPSVSVANISGIRALNPQTNFYAASSFSVNEVSTRGLKITWTVANSGLAKGVGGVIVIQVSGSSISYDAEL